jgi:uncharacterized membrane protein
VETFSDGVVAIVITIMVLEMKAPHDASLAALRPVLPAFLSYVLSFVYIGIYWNNHHHMLHIVQRINGMTLWANLHLLFWISLIPFVTAWMGESNFGTWPVAVYGVVLLMCGVAWEIERRVLLRLHERESALARAMRGRSKELVSLVAYAVAVIVAFINTWAACALYAAVAAIWFTPDRSVERELTTPQVGKHP